MIGLDLLDLQSVGLVVILLENQEACRAREMFGIDQASRLKDNGNCKYVASIPESRLRHRRAGPSGLCVSAGV